MRLFFTYSGRYREKKKFPLEVDNDKTVGNIRILISKKLEIPLSGFQLTLKKFDLRILMTDIWPISFFAEKDDVIKINPLRSLKQNSFSMTSIIFSRETHSFNFTDYDLGILACKKLNFEYFKMIVDRNQNSGFLYDTLPSQWGFLHHACVSGCNEIVEFLIKNNVDPNAVTIDEWTPIQLCCALGNAGCLAELMKSSSLSIDKKTKFRGTALHVACEKNYIECIKLLLEKNSDPFQEDHREKIPVELISSHEAFDILAKYMRKYENSKNPNEKLTNYFGKVFLKKSIFFTKKLVFLLLDVNIGELKCYPNKEAYLDIEKPMLSIMITNIVKVSINYKHKKGYYFNLLTIDKKTHSFMTEFEVTTLEWTDRIKKAMEMSLYYNRISIRAPKPIYQKNGETKIDDFTLIKELGHGSFGTVFKVQNRTSGEYHALKTLNKLNLKKRKHLKYAISEFNIMKKLDHPFIAKLYSAFQTRESLFLVIELCCGDLSKVLDEKMGLNEKTVKIYAAELVLATEYLHNKGIIYRDFKPQNVLISEDFHLKLADFGLAKENFKAPAMTFAGTPIYLAPETVGKKGSTFKSDIYGIGALIYEMLVGKPPFYSENIDSLFKKISKNKLRFPEDISESAKDLISKMMKRNPGKRPQISQIKRHIFFNKIDWEALPKKYTKFTKDTL